MFSKSEIIHPSNERISLTSIFRAEGIATVYQVFEPLSKQNRSNLLKTLHVPKAAKGKKVEVQDDAIEIALNAFDDLKNIQDTFNTQTDEVLETRKVEYQALINPVEPEILPPPPMPPFTPSPKLLQAQQDFYSPKVGSVPTLSYWNSHEADFGFPDSL